MRCTPSRRRRVFKWMIARGDRVIAAVIAKEYLSVKLYVTCDCTHKNPVLPARCGESIRCICGKDVKVPPLSELRRQNQSDVVASHAGVQSNEPHIQDLKPVRYWAFPIAALLVVYGIFQCVTLPQRFGLGVSVVGIQVTVAAVALLGGLAMFKFAVPRN